MNEPFKILIPKAIPDLSTQRLSGRVTRRERERRYGNRAAARKMWQKTKEMWTREEVLTKAVMS